MIFGRRIEVLLGAYDWWLDAGVFLTKLPESTVPVGLVDLTAEEGPTIFIHGESKGQENNLIQSRKEELIDACLLVEHKVLEQADLLKMFGCRHRQR